MPKIVDVDFCYEDGEHSTIGGTSGNPGYTKLPQYWIVMKLDDGKEARVNLKNGFKGLFKGKRITKDKREAIKALVEDKKNLLIGRDVNLTSRSYVYALKSYWQKEKNRKYDKMPYIGLDDSSLREIREILERPIKEIFK